MNRKDIQQSLKRTRQLALTGNLNTNYKGAYAEEQSDAKIIFKNNGRKRVKEIKCNKLNKKRINK